jgi:hypothetical protein
MDLSDAFSLSKLYLFSSSATSTKRKLEDMYDDDMGEPPINNPPFSSSCCCLIDAALRANPAFYGSSTLSFTGVDDDLISSFADLDDDNDNMSVMSNADLDDNDNMSVMSNANLDDNDNMSVMSNGGRGVPDEDEPIAVATATEIIDLTGDSDEESLPALRRSGRVCQASVRLRRL